MFKKKRKEAKKEEISETKARQNAEIALAIASFEEAKKKNDKVTIANVKAKLTEQYLAVDTEFKIAATEKSHFDANKVASLFNQRNSILHALRPKTWKDKLLEAIVSGEFSKIIPEKEKDRNLIPNRLLDFTVDSLIIAYNNSSSDALKSQIEVIIMKILDEFFQQKVRTLESLKVITVIGAIQNKHICSQVLNKFLKCLKSEPILDIHLVKSIAEFIRFANHRSDGTIVSHIDSDEMVQILKVTVNRLEQLHKQSSKKLKALLEVLVQLMNSMIDQGVSGLSSNMEDLSSSLKDIAGDSEVDSDIRFLASYAKEALARIPEENSSLRKYFGCVVEIVKNVVSIGSAAAQMAPSDLLQGILDLKESISNTINTVQRNLKSSWYEQFRVAENYLNRDRQSFENLYKLLHSPEISKAEPFVYGIVMYLSAMLLDMKDPSYRRKILSLLTRMAAVSISSKTNTSNYSFSIFDRNSSSINKSSIIWPSYPVVQQKVLHILKRNIHQERYNSNNDLFFTIEKHYQEHVIKALESQLANKNEGKQIFKLKFLKTGSSSEVVASPSKEEDIKFIFMDFETSVKRNLSLSNQIVRKSYKSALPQEYCLDTIWNQMEQLFKSEAFSEGLKYYISLNGAERIEDVSYNSFPLIEKLTELLDNWHENSVILVQGPSGSGKSSFIQHLIKERWDSYSYGNSIPLFISLGQLKDPGNRCVEQVLESFGCTEMEIQQLRNEKKFVLFLDGFDEVKTVKNLYESNKLSTWNAKVVITCRTGILVGNYQKLFTANKKPPKEYYIAPFNTLQIKQYLDQVKKSEPLKDIPTFEEIYEVAGVKNLIESPFLLKIMVEIWPQLKKLRNWDSNRVLSRTSVYQLFIDQWFKLKEEELIRRGDVRIPRGFLLQKSFQEYSEELAFELFIKNQVAALVKPNQYRKQADVMKDPWVRFFSDEEVTRIARSGAPLKYTGNSAQFIHKSLQEYFIACVLFEEISLNPSSPLNEDSFMNKRLLGYEYGVLSFLQDMIANDADRLEALFSMVVVSRTKPGCSIMSSNAISILAYLKVSMKERDFHSVQIPDANLTGAILDHVNLSGSNLMRVNLSNCWIRDCNMTNCQLNDIKLGELPYIQSHNDSNEEFISAIVINKQGYIAVTCGQFINICDPASMEPIQSFQNATSVFSLSFHSNGRLLASGSKQGGVTIWDTISGKSEEVIQITGGKSAQVAFIGNILVVLLQHDIMILDAEKQFKTIEKLSRKFISCMDASIHGIVFGDFKTVSIWDYKKNNVVSWKAHTSQIASLSMSPLGTMVVSTAKDKTLKVWSVESHECLYTLQTESYGRALFSPSGSYLAVLVFRNVKVIDILSDQKSEVSYDHPALTVKAAFNQTDSRLLCGCSDGKIYSWEVNFNAKEVNSQEHNSRVYAIAFHPNGEQIVSGDKSGLILQRDIKDKTIVPFYGHTDEISSLKYSPNGDILASSSKDRTIRLWNISTAKMILLIEGHQRDVRSIAFNPDGTLIASSSYDETIRIWDTKTGFQQRILHWNSSLPWSVNWSPDGRYIGFSTSIRLACLWDLDADNVIELKGHSEWVNGILFTQDGKSIITCSDDRTIRVWDRESYTCQKVIEAHDDQILKIDADDSYLVSSSTDGCVKVWSLSTFSCIDTLRGYLGGIYTVAINKKNKYIVTGALDKTVKVWTPCKLVNGENKWQLEFTNIPFLYAKDCKLNGATGLTDNVFKLLSQKGATGIPHFSTLSNPYWNEFIVAAANGDTKELEEYYQKGEYLKINSDIVSPLHVAAQMGQVRSLQFILERKIVPVNKGLQNGKTALHLAVKSGVLEAVEYLLKEGATVNIQDTFGDTPLHVACSEGFLKIASLLLKFGADPNKANSKGRIPLHVAVQKASASDLVKLLLESKSDINSKENSLDFTPLHLAAKMSDIATIKLLLDSGANLESIDKEGRTPLFQAIDFRTLNCFKVLLEYKANVNVKDKEETTPLIVAAQKQLPGHIEELLIRGADIEAKNKYQNSALATLLSRSGSNDRNGAAKILLSFGADVNNTAKDKQTPLMIAIKSENTDFVPILLAKGADINLVDKSGSTALHYAAINRQIEAVKLLLKAGAKKDVYDENGLMPVHAAAQGGDISVVELLLEGEDINVRSKKNFTLLHLAAANGKTELVSMLLKKGADINVLNDEECTPLHRAANFGYTKTVQLLLEKGADPSIKQKNHKTALQLAQDENFSDVVELIKQYTK